MTLPTTTHGRMNNDAPRKYYTLLVIVALMVVLLPAAMGGLRNNSAESATGLNLNDETMDPPPPPTMEEMGDLCVDVHQDCEAWAKRGECNINPRYMKMACAKSCNHCK